MYDQLHIINDPDSNQVCASSLKYHATDKQE